MSTKSNQKGEKITIVATANAIVHPRTMMIERFDTMIADTAMRTSWRTIKLASCAPEKIW